MGYETLEIERRGPLARVWLDRPERRNALNRTALEELEDCFTGLQRDFALRAVVLGGRGKSFCAGADRKDPPGVASAADSARERRHGAQLGLRVCRAIAELESVTVARVHGHAVGGGLALALACDLRVCADDAWFSIPEVDLGVPLSWGATPRLIQEIGAARARELILMCEPIDGRRAAELGVAHRSVPAAELDAAVDAWLERIVAKPEIAVHMTKTQFRAYAHAAPLGDVSETDGDVLLAASRVGVARRSFPRRDES